MRGCGRARGSEREGDRTGLTRRRYIGRDRQGAIYMDRQFAMLWQLRVCALAVIVAYLCACSSNRNQALSRNTLAGTWQLRIGSSCSSRGVISDRLILYSDGRLEQHAIYGSEKRYDALDQHWDVMPDKSVSLRNWLDLTDNPTGKPTFAVLLVETKDPPTILVNPDSDCFYLKESNR